MKIYYINLGGNLVSVKAKTKKQICEHFSISLHELNYNCDVSELNEWKNKDIDCNLTITNEDIIIFKKLTRDTAYNKSYTESYIGFHHGVSGKEDSVLINFMEHIPSFQRNNDKWTNKMQISYVENVLKGLNNPILIYTLKDNSKRFILDGLQRITALNLFINNELKVFEKYNYIDILHKVDAFTRINVKQYKFNTEIEAVEFYILMNENITHSKADIQRAKDYLIQLKNM